MDVGSIRKQQAVLDHAMGKMRLQWEHWKLYSAEQMPEQEHASGEEEENSDEEKSEEGEEGEVEGKQSVLETAEVDLQGENSSQGAIAASVDPGSHAGQGGDPVQDP